MSNKKLKFNDENSSCFWTRELPLCLSSHICSFLELEEIMTKVERCCVHLRDAGRHPTAFRGKVLDLGPFIKSDCDPSALLKFVRLRSPDVLRCIWSLVLKNENVSGVHAVVCALGASSVRLLQITYDGEFAGPIRCLFFLSANRW
jgi:hypothetical protein